MRQRKDYKTKQREAVLAYIASIGDAHVTAAQIVGHFECGPLTIGRTTVYRHLEKLTEEGKVRRYAMGGASGACYQYVGGSDGCQVHMHLKCEGCGELFHLQCDEMGEMRQHILDEHAFHVNAVKTVFYGICESCADEGARMATSAKGEGHL